MIKDNYEEHVKSQNQPNIIMLINNQLYNGHNQHHDFNRIQHLFLPCSLIFPNNKHNLRKRGQKVDQTIR